ncbi:MAG: hypothetical protein H0T84_11975 [Tatlockia sp.]|nr:hypothetical protein [Tatlockia sp.]
MKRAIRGLTLVATLILIEGNRSPKLLPHENHSCWDRLIKSISDASIIAKVTQDRIMREFHNVYLFYNFAQHKGYPTKERQILLKQCGESPIHRQSFTAVKNELIKKNLLVFHCNEKRV